jgi:hypothetical protein
MSASRPPYSSRLGWPHWLAALLFGLMLVLLVLMASWLLRAFAPHDPLLNFTVRETIAPPAAPPPPDKTLALRASLDQTTSVGKALAGELGSLQAELSSKVASCKPIEPRELTPLQADRWAKKDMSLLKGCWVLGHDAEGWRGKLGSAEREKCTTKAARMCFDADGHGQIEGTMVCPVSGTIYCASPATAQFMNDGTFSTTSPATQCQRGPRTRTEYTTTSCRRVDDYHAMCRRTNFSQLDPPGVRPQEIEFRREQ